MMKREESPSALLHDGRAQECLPFFLVRFKGQRSHLCCLTSVFGSSFPVGQVPLGSLHTTQRSACQGLSLHPYVTVISTLRFRKRTTSGPVSFAPRVCVGG